MTKHNVPNGKISLKPSEIFAAVLLVVTLIQFSQLTHVDSLSNFIVLGFDIQTPIWLMCYTFALCMLFAMDRTNWLIWFCKKETVFALLILFACASVFWSVDELTTVKRGVHLLGICIVSLCIAVNLSTELLRKLLVVTLVCLIFLNTFVSIFIPSVGVMQVDFALGAWQGLTTHKNNFGMIASIAAFVSIYQCFFSASKFRRFVWLFVACISVIVIFMCDSATSLLCLLAGSCTIIGLYSLRVTKIGRKFLYLLFAFLIVIALIGIAMLEFRYGDAVYVVGRDGTLTGRTRLWSVVWQIVKERPLIGHGYGSIWAPDSENAQNMYSYYVGSHGLQWGSPIVHAHNGFLQVASDLGVLIASLAVFFVLKILAAAVKLYKRTGNSESIFIASLCSFIITHNIAEASILQSRSLIWYVFLMFILQFSLKRKV